ncbi:hypothetical protein EGH21_11040 [Halomicroarcula sp. F13]|uniref:DUF7344 domain-containing protein n=1 Tax=Haloarcula rubra TaxID=2487747 RepID=A0AAW4PTT1_9EURY|nr:hypothetical protein [Halomicroarcula rubra]MBX0323564.1 hypothetical protein [Halomicroarcula rubra]
MATRGTDDDSDPAALPDSVVDDLLEADSRRLALSILDERDRPVVVGDLAAAVVARRRGVPESAVSDVDREAMREELFTEHIPKLTATGVVEYDSMVGTVELRRRGIVGRGRA